MAAEYKLVSAPSPEELEIAVSTEVENGLIPQGGIGVDTRKIDPVFYQAMYKEA